MGNPASSSCVPDPLKIPALPVRHYDPSGLGVQVGSTPSPEQLGCHRSSEEALQEHISAWRPDSQPEDELPVVFVLWKPFRDRIP